MTVPGQGKKRASPASLASGTGREHAAAREKTVMLPTPTRWGKTCNRSEGCETSLERRQPFLTGIVRKCPG